MKKFMCLLCVCMLLFSSVVSADQVYAAETGSSQTAAAVKKVHIKSGTETTIHAGTEQSPKVVWKVKNTKDPKTKEKLVNVKELDDGGLLIQGLGPGTCNVTALTEEGTYQFQVVIHTNGFQKQRTIIHLTGIDSLGNGVWKNTVSWKKVKGAEGYVVYARPDGCRVYHKLKVLKGKDQLSWTRVMRNYPRIADYGVRAFKTTKAGITIYTPVLTGYNKVADRVVEHK